MQEDDADAPAPVQQKVAFTVKLVKFDETKKVALIKEIKNLVAGMNLVQVSFLTFVNVFVLDEIFVLNSFLSNLYDSGINVQAKKFVESVPQNVRTDVPKEEAETLKKALEALGANVEIV